MKKWTLLGGQHPITGIAGCCARAASAQAVAPPTSVMKSRRLISSPQPEDRAPYHTVVGNAPLCITTNLAANVRDRSNSTELAEVTTSIYDRGRDASCLAPPAQIRTCPIRA